MSGLKTLRTRINSIRQTEKITSAMKMISVPKLRKAYAALLESYAYADESNRIIRRLVRSATWRQEQQDETNTPQKIEFPLLLTGRPNSKKHLLVSITSDEGLCGQFNQSIISKTEKVIQKIILDNETPELLCFGYKGGEILKKKYPHLSIKTVSGHILGRGDAFADAYKLMTSLIDGFYKEDFDICTFVYSRFQSAAVQKIQIEQLIPVSMFQHKNKWQALIDDTEPFYTERDFTGNKKVKPSSASLFTAIGGQYITSPLGDIDAQNLLKMSTRSPETYDYEPYDLELLESFLPSYLNAYVYRILLETTASENASRMMEMENATKNANEMLSSLNKLYHRKRQEKITTDIIEGITGGTLS